MNTRMKITLLVAVLLCLVPPRATAGDRSGTVAENFLKLPLDARTVGLAGAEVALAWGPTSIAYNAAGMMAVDDYAFGATYTSWFAGISNGFAGVVKRIPDVGAIGVGVVSLSSGDMAETTPQYPEGTGRTFQTSDYAFSVAFARQVSDQFMVGINGKVIRSYLFNTEVGAGTFAIDIGTLYDIPILHSRLGVSLTNIGKDIQFINETYSLPTALRFGVLVDVMKDNQQSLVSTLQVSRLNDANELYAFGAEYTFDNVVALRGGRKFGYDQENWTFGFGVKVNSMGLNGTVDYGFNNFVYLPATHTFTFALQF